MTALLSRNHILLLGLCSMLTVLLVYEWIAPPAPIEVPTLTWRAPDGVRPLAPAPPFPANERFASIDARPLLNPARKALPDAGAATSGTTLPPPTDVVLVGIIIDGDRRLALLRLPSSVFASSVSVGDDVGGWKVKTIEPNRVVLQSGANEYQLTQNSGHGAGAPPAPPTAQDGAL